MSLRKKQSLKEEPKAGKLRRWKITFHWPNKSLLKKPFLPKEFICPISLSLMADPVIVSSGQTLDRNCALICKKLSFYPIMADGSVLEFSNIIPNLSLKTAILNWCKTHLVDVPEPVDTLSAEKLVRKLMASPSQILAESTRSSSSVESVAAALPPPTPLPLATRPACLSSSSSSEDTETANPSFDNIISGLVSQQTEVLNTDSGENEDIISGFRNNLVVSEQEKVLECEDTIFRLRSNIVSEQEKVLVSLRRITRTREETRARLCGPGLLSALRPLILSGYINVQVNAVACLVNLSLEDQNKVKIVRSGLVPPLINVLKGGFPEAAGHAAGALFSLAIDDRNKTAIGVLGALPPLMNCLRAESCRARHDSALALCHLSLVQSNRSKLVKLGAVHVLLGMVKAGHMTGRVMLVLCNLALGADGRGAMLDGGAVECFVGELESESTHESCLVALYRLSFGGLRFKVLAKEAQAEVALLKAESVASEKGREKVRRVLEVLRGKEEEEEEELDWEELLKTDDATSRTF